ncbi:hypothetical protein LEP1GSC128_2196 [Leptospira borgpetersenii str. 200801926]|uniref:Uncharacterized protein n=1 Tax=Leptospira borgpetersenii str. 200801926 TaxID=1193009 RepID=A0ABP2S869_LEPBO|nr:hypothetical protein LEP1GSC128_2196 [Leptospira borgpetersenii str. 200801926]
MNRLSRKAGERNENILLGRSRKFNISLDGLIALNLRYNVYPPQLLRSEEIRRNFDKSTVKLTPASDL